jgi:D-alanyl-lipoteichoic acid acyltransferase DltB (MBOAT superfamily)
VTIFDYLKDIVVDKTGSLSLDQYSPFIINRWISFINPSLCEAIRMIDQKTLLENKEMHYKAMISFFPKMKFVPKINYCKKVKELTKNLEENSLIKIAAEKLELSTREVQEMEMMYSRNSSNISQI